MSETMPEQPAEPAEPVTPDHVETAPVAEQPPAEVVNTGASNESPVLPPSVVASAARAHALLGHMMTMAAQLQADIERYVPAGTLAAAKVEVASVIRAIL